jgi:endonuclease/exonuclease/phosphatase family metal-dependent hydrolase
MHTLRFAGWIALAGMLMAPTPFRPTDYTDADEMANLPQNTGGLSVMTYNVRGLPWPAAWGRGPALAEIGKRLAAMRDRNTQPQVVLLQEAFTDDAKAIARQAGYRHIVVGPQQAPAADAAPLGEGFAAAARWDRGELSESLLDSGLLILSDYPIVQSRNFAFPRGACAGFDCLAAKGVMIAWIAVPDVPQPIAIINTHLNSRRATHVASERADQAYVWQVNATRRFVSENVERDMPAIFGGDLNGGKSPRRLSALAQPMLDASERDGLSTALTLPGIPDSTRAEASQIVKRNKDRLISRNGNGITLAPRRASVPFGIRSATAPLSDHAGFVIEYAMVR